MRFVVTADQRFFFSKHGYIQFQDLIAIDQATSIHLAVTTELLRRNPQAIDNPKVFFTAGWNLSKTVDSIKKCVQYPALAAILGELLPVKTVYFGFDQAIVVQEKVEPLFHHSLSLQQMSCIQPICGGIILSLTSGEPRHSFIPSSCGSAVFFSATTALPWAEFTSQSHQSFLLIGYCSSKPQYLLQPNDLHTHQLKKEGFAFGDQLPNPCLYPRH